MKTSFGLSREITHHLNVLYFHCIREPHLVAASLLIFKNCTSPCHRTLDQLTRKKHNPLLKSGRGCLYWHLFFKEEFFFSPFLNACVTPHTLSAVCAYAEPFVWQRDKRFPKLGRAIVKFRPLKAKDGNLAGVAEYCCHHHHHHRCILDPLLWMFVSPFYTFYLSFSLFCLSVLFIQILL